MLPVVAVLSAVLLTIPALILHECGHLAAALLFGVKVKKVGISRTGLYTVREAGPRLANLCISFSGPLVNLLLAAAFQATWPRFAQVNLIVGVFNLLPFPHSDGARILALLRRWSEALPVQHRQKTPASLLGPTAV
jgi:stage IV sporulation protein FB